MTCRKETDGVRRPHALGLVRLAGRLAASLALASLTLIVGTVARAEDPGYELVRSEPPARLAPGAHAVLSLSVVPRSGYRLHADAPVQLRLVGSGVRPQRTVYERADAADPRADVPRFDLAITAEPHKGAAQLDAALVFYLCKGSRCRPVETSTRWSLQID